MKSPRQWLYAALPAFMVFSNAVLSLLALLAVDYSPCVTGHNVKIAAQFGYIGFPIAKTLAKIGYLFHGEFSWKHMRIFAEMVIISALDKLWVDRSPMAISSGQPVWHCVCPMKIASFLARFGHHIGAIIFIRPGKQVVSITTGWIVASVTGVQRRKIPSKGKEESNPMSASVYFIGAAKRSIAVFVSRPHPWPAFIGVSDFNVLPKSLNVALAKCGDWFRIISSHLTLPQGELVRIGVA